MAEKVGELTGQVTEAGRPVYKTPDGELVSEKSVTIPMGNKFINIPSIHDGIRYSEDEIIEMLKDNKIEATSVHDSMEDAIEAAKSRSSKLLSKGGSMESQMDMFEHGGLLDEGGSVDPVSGNDVPTGSTKEEVRDDIDANLSEGEFVLPADVVRYIGLENIMKMRDMAKEGLAKMEAMGQMGNSEEATMDDESDFEAEIDEFIESLDREEDEAEFAVGGLAGQPTTPEQQAGQIYAQMTGGQFLPPGVSAPGVKTDLPSAPVIKPSGEGAGGVPTYETKQYIGPNGEIRTFTFINGQAFPPIPEGFTLYDPTKIPEVKTGVPTAQVTQDGGDGPEDTSVKTAKVDPVSGIAKSFAEDNPDSKVAKTVKELQNLKDKYDKTVGLSLATTFMGGGVGGLAGLIYGSVKYNKQAKELNDRLNAELMEAIGPAAESIIRQAGQLDPNRFTEQAVQESYTQAIKAGASPALASAIATTTSRAFSEIPEDTDLGAWEQSTADIFRDVTGGVTIGIDPASSQQAMLTEQDFGLFDTPEERAAFYASAPPTPSNTGFQRTVNGIPVDDYSTQRGVTNLTGSFTVAGKPYQTTARSFAVPGITSGVAGTQAKSLDYFIDQVQNPQIAQQLYEQQFDTGTSALTTQAKEAARAPSRTVTKDSHVGSRNFSVGESVTFSGADGRETTVTGKSYTDASGTTRSGGFVDTNQDGVQQKSERSTVTSTGGSTITDRNGNPVTSRSQEDIEKETGGGNTTDCFMPHTLVTMADGSKKEIKEIVEGDEILGVYGSTNKVLGIEKHEIKAEDGYWIVSHDKDVEPFFTVNHPFFHENQLVSFSKDKNDKFNPWLKNLKSAWEYFSSAYQSVAPKGTVLYNLYLDGDYTLYANGLPFHNIVTNGFITMSLYNTGKITQHDLESDVAYTKTVKNPLVRLGYTKIAIPLADEVRKGTFLGKCVSSVCTPFVKGISALSNDKPAPFVKLLGYTFVYPTFLVIGALDQIKGKYS